MANILDNSKTYLSIFNRSVEVNYNLKKWQINKEYNKDKIKEEGDPFSNTKIIKDEYISTEISLSDFLGYDKKEFNIYVGKRIFNTFKNYHYDYNDIDGNISEFDILRKKENNSFIHKIKSVFKKFFNRNDKFDTKEKYALDIFSFFDKVKLTAKENGQKYISRIEPYMIALKQANELGQEALADSLAQEIFNNKYESILYSEGLCYKVTEEQVVDFVKKTEKGVQLSYIKNFTRPIPKEVIEKKKKADDLLVFDNYCVLYYDPEGKSYSQTEKEKKIERKKKSDPILFGMISGSRNLYYVADWIDEYCDLTLDEFIKVSGIEKEKLEITEKIKL